MVDDRDGTGASRPAGDRVNSVAGGGFKGRGKDGAIRGAMGGGIRVVVIIDGVPCCCLKYRYGS